MPKTSTIMSKLSNETTSSSKLDELVKESDEKAHRHFLLRATGSETGFYYWRTSTKNLQQNMPGRIDFDMAKLNFMIFGLDAQKMIEELKNKEELESKDTHQKRPSK